MFDYNYYKTDFYDDALKYIDEYGVKTYGVLVFGTAEDFLESIHDIPMIVCILMRFYRQNQIYIINKKRISFKIKVNGDM